MDDDTTIEKVTYKLTIAGEEYEFGQPDPELLGRMILISHMNAGSLLTLDAITKWLASAAGPVTWQRIMRRFITEEISAQDLLTAMDDLTKLVITKQDAASDAA